MNKILNYSAIKHYKFPSRKSAFKYADTFIAIIFLIMLIKQLITLYPADVAIKHRS